MKDTTPSQVGFLFIDKNASSELVESYGKNCLHGVIEPHLLKRFLNGECLPQQNIAVTNFIINSIIDERYDEVGAIISLSNLIHPAFFAYLAGNLLIYIAPDSSYLLIRTLTSVFKSISGEITPEIADEILKMYTNIAVPGLLSSDSKETKVEKPSYKQDTKIDEKTDQAIEEALESIFSLNDLCENLLSHEYFSMLFDGLKNDKLLFYRGTIVCLIYRLVTNSSSGDLGFSFADQVEKEGIVDFLMDDTLTFISDSHEKMIELGIETCSSETTLCGRAYFYSELIFRLRLVIYCIENSILTPYSGLSDKFTHFYTKISDGTWEYPKDILFEALTEAIKSGGTIADKINLASIQDYEYKKMLKTLEPSHFLSKEDNFDFYLLIFDKIKSNTLILEKPNTKLFWDVVSSGKKKFIRKKVFQEVRSRYKDINTITKEILSALRSHSDMFTKETGERKVLLRNKVLALLDFYADFISENRNQKGSTFNLPNDSEDTAEVNVTLGDVTKSITFSGIIDTEEFFDEISVSFFGGKKSTLHDLHKDKKLRLFTLSVGGEESRLIPGGTVDLRNITDVLVQVPNDTEVILTKEMKDVKRDGMNEDEPKKFSTQMSNFLSRLIGNNPPMKVYSRKKEQDHRASDEIDKIEDIFDEPPDKEDDSFPPPQQKKVKETKWGVILEFTKFLFQLLNTNHFEIEEEEKEDFATEETILRLLTLLPHTALTTQTLSEFALGDDTEPILFSKKYHKICAETYILDRAQKLNLSGKTILEDIFGHSLAKADTNTSVLTHIRYLQAKLFGTLKDVNRVYHKTTAKLIETILPLCTFTEERARILFEHIQSLLTNPDIDDSIKVEVGYATSKMVITQKNPDNDLVHLLRNVLQEKDLIVRGFTSTDRHIGATLRKTLYTFFMDLRTKDKLAFRIALNNLTSYARIIAKNCGDSTVTGEYFNLINDIFTDCGSELSTDLSVSVLQKISDLLIKEKQQHNPFSNVVLKLFCTIGERHPETIRKLKKKEAIAVALCSFNSFNPFTTKAIQLVTSHCEEFKKVLTNCIRRHLVKYTLPPQCTIQFFPKNSLELCLLHILSNIPTLERALLDVNTDECRDAFIQGIHKLFMWFNSGNDKVAPRVVGDIVISLLELNNKIRDLTPQDAFTAVLCSLFSSPNAEIGVCPLKVRMALNMGQGRATAEVSTSGVGLLVPAKKTITDSVHCITKFSEDNIGFENREIVFSDLPLFLIICVSYKEGKNNIVPEFKETVPIREFVPVVGGKDAPESDCSYTLCGLILTSSENGKNEYLSCIKSKDKWFNVNKEAMNAEELHSPSRKPLFLVYTRPFIGAKDINGTTEITLDKNGFLSVTPCDTPRNKLLMSKIRDVEEGIELFREPVSAERVHFAFQTMEISDWPEEVIRYITRAAYINDKSFDAEIEEHMEAISQSVRHSSRWRKGFIGNFERNTLFSLWERSKNRKLLDSITQLYSTSFILEGLDKSTLSGKIVQRLADFCAYNKNCYHCLKVLEAIGESGDNMEMLCDSSVSNIMSFLLKGDDKENGKPDKSVVKEASKILSRSICFVLKRKEEGIEEGSRGLLTQRELNELLIQDNLLKTILDGCEQKDGENMVELISRNDTEMLVPLAKAVLELLRRSKDVEEDAKAFSYIKAYLRAEDKYTLMRIRLILSPHTFQSYGVLSVHHRAREMSLNRLSLYIDFMMGLGPNKAKLLSRWRQDIAAFEDLLVQKLKVIIDKDVVLWDFAKSELDYGVPKSKSKYWTGEKAPKRMLTQSDKDLLKQAILFKNEISNHVLLQAEGTSRTTESMKENAFLKTILAANAACTGSTEGEFANTTEGAIAVCDVLAKSQNYEAEPKQQSKKSVSFKLFDKKPKLNPIIIDDDDL